MAIIISQWLIMEGSIQTKRHLRCVHRFFVSSKHVSELCVNRTLIDACLRVFAINGGKKITEPGG